LRFEEDGVWDQHLELDFDPQHGFLLRCHPDALATINGKSTQRAVLRNGDVIGLGSLKLQYWFTDVRQRGLRVRENLTWITIALISLGQVALIYWLLR
jgi:hypothetical protein